VEIFRASRSSFIVESRTRKGPPCSGGPFFLDRGSGENRC
jgi:hypothetical protein